MSATAATPPPIAGIGPCGPARTTAHWPTIRQAANGPLTIKHRRQEGLAPGLVPGPSHHFLRGGVRRVWRGMGPPRLGHPPPGLSVAGLPLRAPPALPAHRPDHLDPLSRLHALDRPHRLQL